MNKEQIVVTRTLALLAEIKSLVKRQLCDGCDIVETSAGWSLAFKTKHGVRTLASTRDPYYPKLYNGLTGPVHLIKTLGITEAKVIFLKDK